MAQDLWLIHVPPEIRYGPMRRVFAPRIKFNLRKRRGLWWGASATLAEFTTTSLLASVHAEQAASSLTDHIGSWLLRATTGLFIFYKIYQCWSLGKSPTDFGIHSRRMPLVFTTFNILFKLLYNFYFIFALLQIYNIG